MTTGSSTTPTTTTLDLLLRFFHHPQQAIVQTRSSSRRLLSSNSNIWQDTDDTDDDDNEESDEQLLAASGEWDDRILKFQTIHLTGRIGNQPEIRYLDDGKVVINNLSLATKRKYHSMERQAEKVAWGQEETDWYGLEIWGPTAEFVNQYVDKGTHVSIVGSLQIDEWNDKETGELRNRVKVVVRDFDILESKEEAQARRGRSSTSDTDGKPYYGRDDGGPSSAGSGSFF